MSGAHLFDGTMSTGVSFFSHGEVKQISSVTRYSWTVNNFCVCRKKYGEVIDSPIISAGADGEHRWRMLLFPKGRNEESKDYVSIYLFLLSCKENKIEVHAKFSIMNEHNEEFNEKKVVHQTLHRGKGFGCPDFIKREVLLDKSNGLLPHGSLNLIVEISTGVGPSLEHSISTVSLVSDLSPAEKHLADDLETLLDDDTYTDVKLYAKGGREFRAHRNILAARSPLFAKTFNTKSSKSEIELKSTEPEILEEVLRFIYTGKIENVTRLAEQLLVASNNFELEGMKILCEAELCKNLTTENAVDMLILADKNRAEKLKTKVLGFMIMHAKEIVETPGYKYLANSQQLHLLADVFKAFAMQDDVPKAC